MELRHTMSADRRNTGLLDTTNATLNLVSTSAGPIVSSTELGHESLITITSCG